MAGFITIFIICAISANVYARDDHDNFSALDSLDEPSACEETLTPVQDAIGYYHSRLPDPGTYWFSKSQLTSLFKLRQRAKAYGATKNSSTNEKDPSKKLAMIETQEEADVVGIILRRKVALAEIFSLQDINQKILFGAFQRLAYKFAQLKLVTYPNYNLDDIAQAAMIGLYKAILDYHHTSPWLFSPLAYNSMRSQLVHVFPIEVSPWDLHILSYDYRVILAIQSSLTTKLGRTPSNEEVAEAYNTKHKNKINESTVGRVLKKKNVADATSSTLPTYGRNSRFDSDEALFTTFSTLGLAQGDESLEPEQEFKRRQLRQIIAEAVDTLTPREAFVLQMRFGFSLIRSSAENGELKVDMQALDHDGMTLNEIGSAIGVTKERIREIETRAIRKLKHPSRTDRLRSALGY